MNYSKKILLLISYLIFLISSLYAQSTGTDQWRLLWDKNKESDMIEYEVYRSIGSSGATTLHPNPEYAVISHYDSNHFLNDSTMELIDDELVKGEQIYYRLKAVDSSGLKSNYSEEVSAAIPLITMLNQNIYKNQQSIQLLLDTCVVDPDHANNLIEWEFSGNVHVNVSIQNRVVIFSRNDTSWYGSEYITFTATDPDTFYDVKDIQVTSHNEILLYKPEVSDIPNQTIRQGQSFNTINLDDYVSDMDNSDNQITWSVSGNTDISVEINTNRIATITPPDTNWIGSETITFTATDPDNQSDSDQASFIVRAKSAPIVTDIPDQTIQEGSNFAVIQLDNYVSDPDDANDQLTWTFTGNSALTITIDGSRNATISYSPGWSSSETIIFRATDPTGLYDEDEATYTVNSSNNPPVVSDIPNQIIVLGATFNEISLDNYVDDQDNNDDEMTWTYYGNSNFTVTIDENRIALISNPNNWIGSETITFRATDPGNLFDQDAALFTVKVDTQKIHAFPIPFQSSKGTASEITFTNLPEGGKLIIYDLLGYLVYEVDILSTQQSWSTLNQHGKWVRSGLYLYAVKDEKGKVIKKDKIIIIR